MNRAKLARASHLHGGLARRSGGWVPDARFIAAAAVLLSAVLLCSCACYVLGRRAGRGSGPKSDGGGGKARAAAVFPMSLRHYEKHKDERP